MRRSGPKAACLRCKTRRANAFFCGERKVRDITSDRITEYAAVRLKGGAKASTANYEMAMLRRGFRLGARAGKVGMRPEISMLHVNNARQGFFEPDQYRAVLKSLAEYLKPVIMVGYLTGWRVESEVLTRQWPHVDFNGGWLRLEPGQSKNGEGRSFPFTPDLRAILEYAARAGQGDRASPRLRHLMGLRPRRWNADQGFPLCLG